MRTLSPEGSNDPNKKDVQDAYSLRCLPQVYEFIYDIINSVNFIDKIYIIDKYIYLSKGPWLCPRKHFSYTEYL